MTQKHENKSIFINFFCPLLPSKSGQKPGKKWVFGREKWACSQFVHKKVGRNRANPNIKWAKPGFETQKWAEKSYQIEPPQAPFDA